MFRKKMFCKVCGSTMLSRVGMVYSCNICSAKMIKPKVAKFKQVNKPTYVG